MATIWVSLSKGKELEGEFTRRSDAEKHADTLYLGCVESEHVSQEEWDALRADEIRQEAEADY
jgi:hypothetical protein